MSQWHFQKHLETEAAKLRASVEIEIYKELLKIQEVKEEGTNTFKTDDMKLTVVGKYTYTVDQERAKNHPELFSVKYEHSKTMLKTMTDDQISIVEDLTTKKVAKPSFKVEKL